MDTAREYLPVCDRSHADKISQAGKFLEIICTQATSGKELVKMPEKEEPQAAQSRTRLGLELGKAVAEAGRALGMDFISSTICDIYLLPFSIKAPMISVKLQDSRGNRFVSLPQQSGFQPCWINILAILAAEEKSQIKADLDKFLQAHRTWECTLPEPCNMFPIQAPVCINLT